MSSSPRATPIWFMKLRDNGVDGVNMRADASDLDAGVNCSSVGLATMQGSDMNRGSGYGDLSNSERPPSKWNRHVKYLKRSEITVNCVKSRSPDPFE